MKKLTIAALLAGQLLTIAQPVAAAEIATARETRAGAFAGLRLRVPLDGGPGQRQVRAGLAVAPTLHSREGDGERRMRVGEGIELGVAGGDRIGLSIAGTPVDRLGLRPDGTAPDGRRAGVSTLGWVAIGAGALLVVTLGVGYLWIDDALDCDPGDDCS